MSDLPKLSKSIADMTPLELDNYRRYLQHELQSMTEQLKEVERQAAAHDASSQKQKAESN